MMEKSEICKQRYKRSYYAQARYYSGDRSDNHIETQQMFRKNFSVYSIPKDEIIEISGEVWDNNNLGGIPVDYDRKKKLIYIDSSEAHTLLIGSTGSKKSRLVVMPLVRILAAAGESMIITDPKAEIYRRTAVHLKNKGYQINILNFRNPQLSDGWNFLSIPYNLYLNGEVDKACEIINDAAINLIPIIGKDPYWDYSSRDLFVGLALLLFRLCKNYHLQQKTVNVQNLINLRMEMFMEANTIDVKKTIYWKEAENDELIMNKLIGTVVCPEKTMACILSTFDQHMSCFSLYPQLMNLLSISTFSFDFVGYKKNAVFIILPDEKTTFHKLASIFLKQSYEHFLTQVYNTCEDNRFPKRINYILDEFSSLPIISDFPQMISASRSRNIRFHLVMQSQKQLFQKYGDETETIQSNCGNWLFLYTKELELLQKISALGGKRDNNDLIPLYKLQHLNKDFGECLIFSGRLYPYFSELADISDYDENKCAVLQMPRIDTNLTIPSLQEQLYKIIDEKNKLSQTKNNDEIMRIDIQKELETKFDELFGTAFDSNAEDNPQ